jgi:hypothetical protein
LILQGQIKEKKHIKKKTPEGPAGDMNVRRKMWKEIPRDEWLAAD